MSDIDRHLVARAQGGDARAFGCLVQKHQHKLARLLSRIIRDPADVEDATQEALLKAYRALPAFRGESAFYTWLYRIGINTAYNHLVAKSRRAPGGETLELDEDGLAQAELSEAETPEGALLARELAATLARAIERLPAELRTAIELREIDVMSYEDIARVMGCPVGTVRSRIFRAREAIAGKLRPLLEPPASRRW